MPAYKSSNGKWYCSFYVKDWQGKSKKIKKEGFRTQRDAKEYERKYIEYKQGSPDMSVQTLFHLFIEDKKARCKPLSVSQFMSLYKNQIAPYFSDTKASKVTNAAARNWQNTIIQKGLSPSTLRNINTLAISIFNFGIRFYGLKTNPFRNCGAMGKKEACTNFLTLEEFYIAEEYFRPNPRMHIIINMLFWGGMRIGELLALTCSDFNFQSNEVSITKTFVRIDGQYIDQSTKSDNADRVIKMPDFVMEEAKQYIKKLYGLSNTNKVFQLTNKSVADQLKRMCSKTGLKPIRVHDLRHSHASLLIELGYSPVMIAKRLGHASPKMTLEVYAHLYPSKQDELAKHLNQLQPKH